MLKVNVVDANNSSDTVRAGQVRKHKYGCYYGLVVKDGNGDFNVIKLVPDGGAVDKFETVYYVFTDEDEVKQDFPIVVDAELTIKGRDSNDR